MKAEVRKPLNLHSVSLKPDTETVEQLIGYTRQSDTLTCIAEYLRSRKHQNIVIGITGYSRYKKEADTDDRTDGGNP